MAYDLINQVDQDALSEDIASLTSPSPSPHDTFRPNPMEPENLEENPAVEAPKMNENIDSRLGSMIRSMASTGTSYDMLEEDDDEKNTPDSVMRGSAEHSDSQSSFIRHESQSTPFKESGRIRTASIGPKLPLRHPTPDLQSFHGAYTKNVERLEESAERLSLTTSLKEEFQKMKFEQRRGQIQSSASVGNASSVRPNSRQISTASMSGSVVGTDTWTKASHHPSFPQTTSPTGSLLPASGSQPSVSGCCMSRELALAQQTPYHDGSHHHEYAHPHIFPRAQSPHPPPPTYQPETHGRRTSLHLSPMHDAEEREQAQMSRSPSNETYHQSNPLFVDFDGVHYTPHPHLSHSRHVSTNRQVGMNQPPLAADAAALSEPPAGEGMVYYPAPVPMMLNLPKRLSQQPSPAERERRRLTALSAIPSEMRKSAGWLNATDAMGSQSTMRASGVPSNLPPQLRASAFFDQPGLGQDVDIKCASAVDTLESILDASAHAPVNAFTDHPFAGHLGGEVYAAEKGGPTSATLERKKKRPNSGSTLLRTSTGITLDTALPRPVSAAGVSVISQNKLTKTRSRPEMNPEGAVHAHGKDNPSRMTANGEGAADELTRPLVEDHEAEHSDEEEEGPEEGIDEGEEPDASLFNGAPTTLLAELQMRKAQQRLRNRTAANAFPNGMHSTLLELDAVAQIQQKSREKKQITLAWEDRDVADPARLDDDDDIPLGILVAGQKAQQNINRPMGLIQKREMEDNEPLSRRRARLRGDDMNRPTSGPSEQQRVSTMYPLDVPGVTDEVLEEHEGESLAERIQRIKAEKGTAADQGAEVCDASSQLGLKAENLAPAARTPEAEETLGQRRKRLREEALNGPRQPSGESSQNLPSAKPRSSMADILSQHPAADTWRPSNELKAASRQSMLPATSIQHDNRRSHMSTFQQPMTNPFFVPRLTPSYPSFNPGMLYMNGVAGFNYNNPMMYSPGQMMQMGGYNQGVYLHDPMMMGPPLDPKQRDMIDRWRQGVAP